MKRYMFLLVVMATTIAFAPIASAQFFPPPCNPIPQDRSITFCYPVDDETVTENFELATGWIKDSLPHTAKEYLDGVLQLSNVPDEIQGVGFGGPYDDKIHTFTIVVTDSQGSFRKSASFRRSLQLPCALPSMDPGFVVCTPSAGEVASRPLRFAAILHSSTGLGRANTIELWVDGTKYGDSAEPLGTTQVKIMNRFFYLPVGTHKITIIAHLPDATKIVKTRTVTIVSYKP